MSLTSTKGVTTSRFLDVEHVVTSLVEVRLLIDDTWVEPCSQKYQHRR